MTAIDQGRTIVIGIGNPDCGDDAAGRAVARRLSLLSAQGRTVVECRGEPIELMAAMKGYDTVILVDAIASVSAPGTLHIIDASAAPLPSAFFSHLSTHGFGLVESIELARVLGELPERLLVVGIEGASFQPGDSMSPMVSKAVAAAADWIVAESDSYAESGRRRSNEIQKGKET